MPARPTSLSAGAVDDGSFTALGRHVGGMPVGADPAHRASTIEGQIARVADIIAYVNHDIDDAVRAGLLHDEDLPKERITILGRTSS